MYYPFNLGKNILCKAKAASLPVCGFLHLLSGVFFWQRIWIRFCVKLAWLFPSETPSKLDIPLIQPFRDTQRYSIRNTLVWFLENRSVPCITFNLLVFPLRFPTAQYQADWWRESPKPTRGPGSGVSNRIALADPDGLMPRAAAQRTQCRYIDVNRLKGLG